jgi:hypothetical protein
VREERERERENVRVRERKKIDKLDRTFSMNVLSLSFPSHMSPSCTFQTQKISPWRVSRQQKNTTLKGGTR